MATSGYEKIDSTRHDNDVTQSVITGGSVLAAIAGIAAVVLAILAFYGANPVLYAAIATICAGVAFLIEGGAVATRASYLAPGPANRQDTGMVSGGMALDSLAGVAGIVLGVLALLGYQPMLLLSIAAIVFGVGVLFESGALARLNTLVLSRARTIPGEGSTVKGTLNTVVSIDALCGIAGIVLGILALLGYMPQTLILASLIVFGCMLLLSGAALAGVIRNLFSYRPTSTARS